jgi:tRNA 2-thiouridine synthesizing protein E
MLKSFLTADQQAVIEVLQIFYAEYHLHPSLRILLKLLETQKAWPKSKASSLYLHQIFPENPLKQASLLGGLPIPRKCL